MLAHCKTKILGFINYFVELFVIISKLLVRQLINVPEPLKFLPGSTGHISVLQALHF